MAIAVDTTSTSAGGSWSHTCTGTNLMLIAAVRSQSPSTTCTYNGVSMTKLASQAYNSGNLFTNVFYLRSPATGANTITASTGSPDYGCAVSYTGVAGIDASGNGAINQNNDTTTGSVTTVVDNSRAILVVGQGGGTSQTAGAGTTERISSTNDLNSIFDPNSNKTPAGSVSLISNYTSGPNSWWIFSIRPPYELSVSDTVTNTDAVKQGTSLSDTIRVNEKYIQTASDTITQSDSATDSGKPWRGTAKSSTTWTNQSKS